MTVAQDSAQDLKLKTIRQFIDEKIAPGVQAHGGEVIIDSLEDNILNLTLTGSCGSCGVHSLTSESIANYILEEFPELDDVVIQ